MDRRSAAALLTSVSRLTAAPGKEAQLQETPTGTIATIGTIFVEDPDGNIVEFVDPSRGISAEVA